MAIEYRGRDGNSDRLPALATELVRQQVAVIAAASGGAPIGGQGGNETIPIVFAVGEDPVQLGLVPASPGPVVT